MSKVIPALSRGMLVIGGLLILTGLGWAIWLQVNQPPEPVITEAGAVVLAITAPLPASATPKPTTLPATATPLPSPTLTETPRAEGPTPTLLPGSTVTPDQPDATPTSPPATPIPPSPTPMPTHSPTPTSPPPAEEPPTRIVASSIELDARVTPMSWELIDQDGTMVSRWIVPKKTAGWHVNSSLPGHEENVVLSGHHNVASKVFRYVIDLDLGDEITLYAGGTPYVYLVTEKYILKEAGMPRKVRQDNAQWIMPSGDERLTLVTCWPYEWPGNTHRVVVVARPPTYFATLSGIAENSGAD